MSVLQQRLCDAGNIPAVQIKEGMVVKMTEIELYERLLEIKDDICEDEYPETYSRLSGIIDEDSREVYVESAFEAAMLLHDCDEASVMPELVAEFVIEIYSEEAENGNSAAMLNLGSLYYMGRAGEKNYEKAVKYYTMADKHGERQATENLGYCYYYGRTGEKDYKKAFHYFVKGALDNHLNSLYKVGDMYRNGYYVEKDENEAFNIYTHCYKQMTETCKYYIGADICVRMGNVYFYGIGTEKDYSLALKYYQEAEQYFYTKIKNGDYFARSGLENVIEKQNEIRKKLFGELPDFDWVRN